MRACICALPVVRPFVHPFVGPYVHSFVSPSPVDETKFQVYPAVTISYDKVGLVP